MLGEFLGNPSGNPEGFLRASLIRHLKGPYKALMDFQGAQGRTREKARGAEQGENRGPRTAGASSPCFGPFPWTPCKTFTNYTGGQVQGPFKGPYEGL